MGGWGVPGRFLGAVLDCGPAGSFDGPSLAGTLGVDPAGILPGGLAAPVVLATGGAGVAAGGLCCTVGVLPVYWGLVEREACLWTYLSCCGFGF